MSSIEMNEVVTRGILREELAKEREWTREWTREWVREQQFATKSDLEIWAGAIIARMEQMFREQQEQTRKDMAELRRDIDRDMQSAVRMVQAQFERDQTLALEPMKDLSERVAAIEDADLPARVSKLERTAGSRQKRSRRAPR
jgi:hypothetical protein